MAGRSRGEELGPGRIPDSWWWDRRRVAERDACVAFAGGEIESEPCVLEVTALVVRLPGGRVLRLGKPGQLAVEATISDERWSLRARSPRWASRSRARPLVARSVLPVPLPRERRNVAGALEHGRVDRRRGPPSRWGSRLSGESRSAALEHGGLERAANEPSAGAIPVIGRIAGSQPCLEADFDRLPAARASGRRHDHADRGGDRVGHPPAIGATSVVPAGRRRRRPRSLPGRIATGQGRAPRLCGPPRIVRRSSDRSRGERRHGRSREDARSSEALSDPPAGVPSATRGDEARSSGSATVRRSRCATLREGAVVARQETRPSSARTSVSRSGSRRAAGWASRPLWWRTTTSAGFGPIRATPSRARRLFRGRRPVGALGSL